MVVSFTSCEGQPAVMLNQLAGHEGLGYRMVLPETGGISCGLLPYLQEWLDGPLGTAEMHISFPNKDHQKFLVNMFCIPI